MAQFSTGDPRQRWLSFGPALTAVHDGTFEEFEEDVSRALRLGFVAPALRTLLTAEGIKAVGCSVALLAVSTPRAVVGATCWMIGKLGGRRGGRNGATAERWMPRRFASRTTILRRTFDDVLFRGRTLGSLPEDRPKLVMVATELRTGSAFYFSKAEAGSWRVGRVDPANVPLAHAVAASAAYPAALPALDELLTVSKRDGSLRTERVMLTDGGIYENLGLSCLWPDRDRKVSIAVEDVDTIIACRAGYGLRVGNPGPFWPSRMAAAYGCTFARAQNLSMSRLFDLKKAGCLRAFVLPYIDLNDGRLEFPPADLVTRASVAGYPTDFNAMPEEWVERLSKRGEQLTLALIREHAPELLPAG